MHTKRAGFALLAAALLIAVVGSAVNANVLRVGMTDYEVYPCTYNANAGYYVPWDGNAAGQFWISAPRWEWGGEGVSLCADSDGSWRDNGVREGDPNPDFVDEYRRTQTAVNARRAAFSRSLVSIAEQVADAERRVIAGTREDYSAARAQCVATREAAQEAAANAEEDEAALLAYNSCIGRAITTYPTVARAVYSDLQASCARNNNRETVQGETGYQACLSEGRIGGYRERTVEYTYARCATFDDPQPDPDGPPGHTFTLCEQRPILDRDGNPIMRDGRVLMQVNLVPEDEGTEEEPARRNVLVFDETENEEERVYTLPIPDPEVTLNPPPTPDPAATPDPSPEPTALYGQERDSDNNLITFDQAHFSGPDPCDTIIDFVDNYWDNLGDSEKESQRWINTRGLVRQVDDDNFCDEFDD